jgi:osmotically-inducible protein OsmY
LSACAPAGTSDSDKGIEAAFTNSYVYKTYLKDDHVKITSKNGDVSLSGEVNDDLDKPMAEHTAEALRGVKSVDNRIVVTGDRPAENSDAWIKLKVKTALAFHRNVSATKTEVDVTEGVVTLKGEASSQAQKELTTEYVKDILGVKDVNNELTVGGTQEPSGKSAGEAIDDASITAQVKVSLAVHRSTSAMNTKVSTEGGVVTVSGRAKNAAEKDLVTKLVENIVGVTRVINNMTEG